jgi:hypothetical protein
VGNRTGEADGSGAAVPAIVDGQALPIGGAEERALFEQWKAERGLPPLDPKLWLELRDGGGL